jgi:hypothetical protein
MVIRMATSKSREQQAASREHFGLVIGFSFERPKSSLR